jgi:TrmH family RNA methyltransferase
MSGMITSTHNSKVQLVRALLGRVKERQKQSAFVAEGVRLVEEALASAWTFRFVLHVPDLNARARGLLRNLAATGVELVPVTAEVMQFLSETEAPQGILAVLEHQPLPIPDPLSFIVILDSIRDPGNLGSLLRTAAAAGVQAAFLSPGTTDAFAPKVVRSGMGAHFRLPIRALDWDGIRLHVRGLQVFLADVAGTIPSWQADFRPPLALIVGGEAEGASVEARNLAQQQVSIPMPGKAESLNAAAAGAILMFEVVRRRSS